jgi:hypothetical protein
LLLQYGQALYAQGVLELGFILNSGLSGGVGKRQQVDIPLGQLLALPRWDWLVTRIDGVEEILKLLFRDYRRTGR